MTTQPHTRPQEDFVDYTESLTDRHGEGPLAAHGVGQNVLILRKLHQPFRRMDKTLADYQLEYRWLTGSCEHERDEAWACVKGSEFTYWTSAELSLTLEAIKYGDCLLSHFNLF